MQKFAVIGLTVGCNVSYAGKVTMGYVLFEENWLFALEYVSMGLVGTIAMESKGRVV